jgi:hypothetical protein
MSLPNRKANFGDLSRGVVIRGRFLFIHPDTTATLSGDVFNCKIA